MRLYGSDVTCGSGGERALSTSGDSSWLRPVTDFIPELATDAKERKASNNEVDNVSWETITVGALASHLAGIGRDADWYPVLAAELMSLGLPDQGGSSNSTCGDLAREMLHRIHTNYPNAVREVIEHQRRRRSRR